MRLYQGRARDIIYSPILRFVCRAPRRILRLAGSVAIQAGLCRYKAYRAGLIKQFWLESGGVYGYRKVYSDLQELGEGCGENRVYRLRRLAGLRAQVGYRRSRHRSGSPNVVVPNRLQRQFNIATPNEAWVTDIAQIRTHEGWLY